MTILFGIFRLDQISHASTVIWYISGGRGMGEWVAWVQTPPPFPQEKSGGRGRVCTQSREGVTYPAGVFRGDRITSLGREEIRSPLKTTCGEAREGGELWKLMSQLKIMPIASHFKKLSLSHSTAAEWTPTSCWPPLWGTCWLKI